MRLAVSLVVAFAVTPAASGEEVKVSAAAGVKAPLLKLAADFETKKGHTIVAVFDTAGATNKSFLLQANRAAPPS